VIFGSGDPTGQLFQLVLSRLLSPQFTPQDLFQQRKGILVVVDRKPSGDSDLLSVAPQQPGSKGVKGLDYNLAPGGT
jgi:hypothetical protein